METKKNPQPAFFSLPLNLFLVLSSLFLHHDYKPWLKNALDFLLDNFFQVIFFFRLDRMSIFFSNHLSNKIVLYFSGTGSATNNSAIQMISYKWPYNSNDQLQMTVQFKWSATNNSAIQIISCKWPYNSNDQLQMTVQFK